MNFKRTVPGWYSIEQVTINGEKVAGVYYHGSDIEDKSVAESGWCEYPVETFGLAE